MASSSLCPHLLQEYFKRIREISETYKSQIVKFVEYEKIKNSLLDRKILKLEEHENILQLPTNEDKMYRTLEIFENRMWGLENLISVLIEVNVDSWLVEEMFQKYVHHIVNEIRRLQSLKSCRCFEHERRSFIRRAVIRFFEKCDEWLFDVGTSLGCLNQTIYPTRNTLQAINNLLPITRNVEDPVILPSIDSAPFDLSYESEDGVEITEVPMDSDRPAFLRQIEGQTMVSSTTDMSAIALPNSNKGNSENHGKKTRSLPNSPKPVTGKESMREKTAIKTSASLSKPSRASPIPLASRDHTKSYLKASPSSIPETDRSIFVPKSDMTSFPHLQHGKTSHENQNTSVVFVPMHLSHQSSEVSSPNEMNGFPSNNYFVFQPVPVTHMQGSSPQLPIYNNASSSGSPHNQFHFPGNSSPAWLLHDNISYSMNHKYNSQEMSFSHLEESPKTKPMTSFSSQTTGSLMDIPEETNAELNPKGSSNPVEKSLRSLPLQYKSLPVIASSKIEGAKSTSQLSGTITREQRQHTVSNLSNLGSRSSSVESSIGKSPIRVTGKPKTPLTKSSMNKPIQASITPKSGVDTSFPSPTKNSATKTTKGLDKNSEIITSVKKNEKPLPTKQELVEDTYFSGIDTEEGVCSNSERSDFNHPGGKIAREFVISTISAEESPLESECTSLRGNGNQFDCETTSRYNEMTVGDTSKVSSLKVSDKLSDKNSGSDTDSSSDIELTESLNQMIKNSKIQNVTTEQAETNLMSPQMIEENMGSTENTKNPAAFDITSEQHEVSDPLQRSPVDNNLVPEMNNSFQNDQNPISFHPHTISHVDIIASNLKSSSTISTSPIISFENTIEQIPEALQLDGSPGTNKQNHSKRDVSAGSIVAHNSAITSSTASNSNSAVATNFESEITFLKPIVEKNIPVATESTVVDKEATNPVIASFLNNAQRYTSDSDSALETNVEKSINIEKPTENVNSKGNEEIQNKIEFIEEDTDPTRFSQVLHRISPVPSYANGALNAKSNTISLNPGHLEDTALTQDMPIRQDAMHPHPNDPIPIVNNSTDEKLTDFPSISLHKNPDPEPSKQPFQESGGIIEEKALTDIQSHSREMCLNPLEPFPENVLNSSNNAKNVEADELNAEAVLTQESKPVIVQDNIKSSSSATPLTSVDTLPQADSILSSVKSQALQTQSSNPKNVLPSEFSVDKKGKHITSASPQPRSLKNGSKAFTLTTPKSGDNKHEVADVDAKNNTLAQQQKKVLVKEPNSKTNAKTPSSEKSQKSNTKTNAKGASTMKKQSLPSLTQPKQNQDISAKNESPKSNVKKNVISDLISRLTKPTSRSERRHVSKLKQPEPDVDVETKPRRSFKLPSLGNRRPVSASINLSHREASPKVPSPVIPPRSKSASIPKENIDEKVAVKIENNEIINANNSNDNSIRVEDTLDLSDHESSEYSVNSSVFNLSISDPQLDFQFDEMTDIMKIRNYDDRLDKFFDFQIPSSPYTPILTPALKNLTASIISGRRNSALPAPIELVTDHWIFTNSSNPRRWRSDPVLSSQNSLTQAHPACKKKETNTGSNSKLISSENFLGSIHKFSGSAGSVKMTDSSHNSITSPQSPDSKAVLVDASSQTEIKLTASPIRKVAGYKIPSSPTLMRNSTRNSAPERKDVSLVSTTTTRKSLGSAHNVVNAKPLKSASTSTGSLPMSPSSRRKVVSVTQEKPTWNTKKPSPTPPVVQERFSQFSVEDYNFQQWANEWISRTEEKKQAAGNV